MSIKSAEPSTAPAEAPGLATGSAHPAQQDATSSNELASDRKDLDHTGAPLDALESPSRADDKSPAVKRISLSFWRPSVRGRADAAAAAASDPLAPVGHQAKVLFAVLTGQQPPRCTGLLHGSSTSALPFRRKPALLGTPSLSEAALTCEGSIPPAPHLHQSSKAAKRQEKAVRKLKGELSKPDKARRIVSDLKRIEEPISAEAASSAPASTPLLHSTPARGFALAPLELSKPPSSAALPLNDTAKPDSAQLFVLLPPSSFPPTTAGGLGSLAGARTGALNLLADTSGALVRSSGSRDGFIAPFDRIGVFLYWWGFELSLPPPTLVQLARLDSLSTLLPILQALVISGGAPELAPIVRYIANYVQMELGAIKSQDRGCGVVVAATWLLPIALVPRPWDLPLPDEPQA